jgi:anti-sigma factor RsiW
MTEQPKGARDVHWGATAPNESVADGAASLASGHPPDELLLAFADRALAANIEEPVARHIAGCATCAASIQTLHALDDTFRSALRTIDVSEPAEWGLRGERPRRVLDGLSPRDVAESGRGSRGRSRVKAGFKSRSRTKERLSSHSGSLTTSEYATVVGPRTLVQSMFAGSPWIRWAVLALLCGATVAIGITLWRVS